MPSSYKLLFCIFICHLCWVFIHYIILKHIQFTISTVINPVPNVNQLLQFLQV